VARGQKALPPCRLLRSILARFVQRRHAHYRYVRRYTGSFWRTFLPLVAVWFPYQPALLPYNLPFTLRRGHCYLPPARSAPAPADMPAGSGRYLPHYAWLPLPPRHDRLPLLRALPATFTRLPGPACYLPVTALRLPPAWLQLPFHFAAYACRAPYHLLPTVAADAHYGRDGRVLARFGLAAVARAYAFWWVLAAHSLVRTCPTLPVALFNLLLRICRNTSACRPCMVSCVAACWRVWLVGSFRSLPERRNR